MSFRGDNMMSLGRNNRSAVLMALQQSGGTSRKRLAETLKLTPAAITHIAGEMLGEGLLREGDLLKGQGAGRREVLLQINKCAGYALGALINLRQALVSVSRLDGSVVAAEKVPLEPHAPGEKTVVLLCDHLNRLVQENGIPAAKIIGLGIAVRGIVSDDGRSVVNSFGALKEKDFPICEQFEAILGKKAELANNVRALCAAETFLASEAHGAEFFLRCEYGIGAALSVDGRVWHGVSNQGAEIGHIPVVPRGGKLCSCGKCGCLETVASPAAILEDAMAVCSPEETPVLWNIMQEKGKDAVTTEDVFLAARSGDAGVAEVVDRAVRLLAGALKAVIYLIDPGKITLYGRMFDDSFYLSRLLSEMQEGMDQGHKVLMEKSRYNHQLDERCACLLAVSRFFREGGSL